MNRLRCCHVVLLLASGVHFGCEEQADTSPQETARAERERSSDACVAGIDVDRVSAVRIGALGGGMEFGRVTGAAALADTLLAVLDGLANELVLVTTTGREVGRGGGRGNGPGEFLSPAWVRRGGGDTVVVFDGRKRDFTYFDRMGTVLGSGRAPSTVGTGFPVAGPLPDGSMVFATNVTRTGSIRGPKQVVRETEEVVVVDRTGRVLRTIGRFPDTERYQDFSHGFSVILLPFGRRTSYSTLGRYLVVATGDEPVVHLFDTGTGDGHAVSVPLTRRAVTQRDIEEFRRARIASAPDDMTRTIRRRMVAEIPYPSMMAAYRLVHPDPRGLLWVEWADRRDAATLRLTVVDTSGVVVDTVALSDIDEILDVGATYVIARSIDSLGVESVAVIPHSCSP